MTQFSALLIAGPTASGKSALAISCAKKVNGVVINADSMQVYRDLQLLSARPSAQEAAEVPHLLFGHIDRAVNYSVGKWLEDAAAALADARAMGKMPIFVGGTGMYFKALTQGLSEIPAVPEAVRAKVRAEAEGVPVLELHGWLKLLDPDMAARLRPSDPQRILRALEVFEATGKSLSFWQGKRGAPLLDAAACSAWFLNPVRAELFARIDMRFDQMIAQGALAEVEALAARGLDPALPVMRAHGVPGLIAYLKGEISLEAAVARGKMDTRHYAKRQCTFARGQMQFKWVESAGEVEVGLPRRLAPRNDG